MVAVLDLGFASGRSNFLLPLSSYLRQPSPFRPHPRIYYRLSTRSFSRINSPLHPYSRSQFMATLISNKHTETLDSNAWKYIPATSDLPAYHVFLKPIEKPALDTREYQLLRLESGLQALLVHDKDADTSAAAMDIAVGHLSDPVSRICLSFRFRPNADDLLQDDMPGLVSTCHCSRHFSEFLLALLRLIFANTCCSSYVTYAFRKVQ